MKEGFLCIGLLYFLLCITRRASATEYEVDGRIEQTEFNHDGTIRKHTASEFTVYVRDRSWLIHSTDFNPDGVPVYARETGCPNQTEVYEVAGKPNHGFVGFAQWSRDMNTASIVSNNLPIGSSADYYLGSVWLMFASGTYFSELKTNRLTPPYDLNASVLVNPDLKCEASWELASGPSSLPLRITYVDTTRFRKTNAIYEATGVTNVGDLQMASGFVFDQLIGGYGESLAGPFGTNPARPQFHIQTRAIATVTDVRPGLHPDQFFSGSAWNDLRA